MNKEKKNIFLIGFMGAGKSTIARAIKQKLGYPVVEMDERIVKEQGMPISKIFETYGELYFRELETKLIQSLNQQEPTIVSCGGGGNATGKCRLHAGWGKRCISYGNTADHIRTCKKQYGPSTFKRSYECCIHF